MTVIVVGGGPVGMMLAHEMALAGVPPVVLETRTAIDPTIKAGSLTLPAADALRRRGFDLGLETVDEPPGFVGHLAGIPIPVSRVRFDDLTGSAVPTMVGQQDIERMVGRRAAELGVEVRRGVTVSGIESTVDGVRVQTDRGVSTAAWVIGCDGGRSVVRKSAGIGFTGLDGIMTGRQVVISGDGLAEIPPGWHHTPTGVFRRMPGAEVILTAEFDGPPADRDAPITVAEITDSIERVTGVRVGITKVHSATRFTDNTRVADRYRHGRVLLAGDAAHVHPPFGGQGLSLGLVDAAALGWRLAAVATGRAAPALLDDYQAERRPDAERVIELCRAQIGLMRTDERSRAAARLVRRLLDTPDGATEAVREISGARRADH